MTGDVMLEMANSLGYLIQDIVEFILYFATGYVILLLMLFVGVVVILYMRFGKRIIPYHFRT